jgi:hypothetical protein
MPKSIIMNIRRLSLLVVLIMATGVLVHRFHGNRLITVVFDEPILVYQTDPNATALLREHSLNRLRFGHTYTLQGPAISSQTLQAPSPEEHYVLPFDKPFEDLLDCRSIQAMRKLIPTLNGATPGVNSSGPDRNETLVWAWDVWENANRGIMVLKLLVAFNADTGDIKSFYACHGVEK